ASAVVIAKASRLVVNHALELRQSLLDGENLVDLLLILDRRKGHVRMRQNETQLVSNRIRIDRHGDGAEHLRRHDRPIELRPVRADNRKRNAAANAELVQPDGIGANKIEGFRPAPALPDAEVLVPHSGAGAVQIRIADQQLRKSLRQTAGVPRHSPVLPAPLNPPRIQRRCLLWTATLAARSRLISI